MTSSKELHVIFGSGPVGLSVAAELQKKGKQVRVVNRSGQAAVAEGVEVVAGDASNLETVQTLSQGAAVIYNATHASYEKWPEVLPRLQENMIEGAAASGARLVVIDTLYLYGETQGAEMTEATPHTATSRKGRMRAQLAWGYLQAHRVGKAKVAIGRAADFYGPLVTNSALGDNIFPAVLSGKPALTFGNIDLPHSYSYMSDIARGLVALGEREEAWGQDWLLPVVKPISTRQVLQLIEAELGQPVEIFNLASYEQAAATGFFDPIFLNEYRELFYQYTEPQIVNSAKIEKVLGITPTPLKEALAATIAWYKQYLQVA